MVIEQIAQWCINLKKFSYCLLPSFGQMEYRY
jgi:hypothetical protein